MNVSDKILKLKNKIYAKALLEISVEGDVRKDFYPDKLNVINKKTGKRWSVEFYSKPYDDSDGISPTEWCADLKDEKGSVLESAYIDRYFGEKTPDKILFGNSGYGPIWDSVNIEFKKFQREHRRIRDKEYQMQAEASITPAIKKLENLLKKQK